MTLIIGFKCKEGVSLVSDTKITNVGMGESDYGSKILTPLPGVPFIVGAAGYSNLFREFNRKIPFIVRERLGENMVRNIEALIKTGLSRDQAIKQLQKLDEQIMKETQIQMPTENKNKPRTKHEESEEVFIMPYFYSAEHFIDDCKSLIKGISNQFLDMTPYPLEVLVGHKGVGIPPSLRFIDSNGREQEIDNYISIGSGTPFVKKFFDRLYKYNKSMNYLVSLAFATIVYVQDIAREKTVGISNKFPPEAVIVNNNGDYGRIRFSNEKDILKDIRKKIKDFEKIILSFNRIKKLELKK